MDSDNALLEFIGLNSLDQLFYDVPDKIRIKNNSVKNGMSEMELLINSSDIGSRNNSNMSIFLGSGSYNRYIPSAVQNIILRNEFITAYTPYQAEISQGMLQALFEYQSLISDLAEMDVTNSSMYDGPTAMAEAARMAYRITGNNHILVPDNIYRNHLEVLKTYLTGLGITILFYKTNENGTIDLENLKNKIDSNSAAILTYNPSTCGTIDKNIMKIRDIKGKAFHISYYDPISLGVLASPGSYDADIAVAEGQPMGIPMNFGGPYLGLFSFKNEYVRKSPGRLIGETTDSRGKRSFVMTLQTREQHIRRDKAMSNICTNQALMAICSSVYLSVVGSKGLKNIALKSMENVKRTMDVIEKNSSIRRIDSDSLFFTDFVMKGNGNDIFSTLEKKGVLGGIKASRILNRADEKFLLFAATEVITESDLEKLKIALEGI